MKYLVFLIMSFVSNHLYAQSVAFTFDDGLDPQSQAEAGLWNQAILDALADVDLQSVLFPIGRKVDSPAGLELVKAWSEAGHKIGNHTYSHPNLGSRNTTLDGFIADVEKNAQLLQEMQGWIKLLRFPLLKEGETIDKRDGFRTWMLQNNYRSAPVSIDTSDWYYSSRFLSWKTKNPSAELEEFGSAYLDHIWNRANYYQSLSQITLGRSASHIILLHTNAINAEFLPAMIDMFHEKGWSVVDTEEAFKDPIYDMTPNVIPAGESILWSIAKQKGIPDLRYPAEDSVYEEPLLDRLDL